MQRILLVDDSEVLRNQLGEILRKASYEVLVAENGNSGYREAERNTDLSLIIADYNMPDINGIMMVEQIRQLGHHQRTPIFMLTTESSVDLRNKGLARGVNAWVVKPFKPDKLLKGIAEILVR